MRYRRLGNSNLEFTAIGIGTWAIGGDNWNYGWGSQNPEEAIAGIIRGVDLGINWIDTAAAYGAGTSEELVRMALKKIGSDRPYIATKCGLINCEDGSVSPCLKYDSVMTECEASLKRLDLETIDLYQIHWPNPDEDIEECWSALIDLKQQGKVQEIGLSNHSVSQIQRLDALQPAVSSQSPYNMFNRNIENTVLPYCKNNNVGVVCYSPMGKGLLSGGFSAQRARSLEKTDHRSRDKRFESPQIEINLAIVDQLRAIAKASGHSVAQLAIAWVLRKTEITSAIVGVRRPSQIEETVSAAEWVLSDDEILQIESILQEREILLEKTERRDAV